MGLGWMYVLGSAGMWTAVEVNLSTYLMVAK